MRIISGTNKGRHISPPKMFAARPTTDIAKEGLFNVLENNYNFENIRVMDAFAGTGSISYEFASRGCPEIISVEQNSKYAAFIRSMAETLKFSQIMVMCADVFKLRLSSFKPFDVIFADPPYDLPNLATIPDLFFGANMLTPEGWLILEHSRDYDFKDNIHFERVRNYGKVHFSFFSLQGQGDETADKK